MTLLGKEKIIFLNLFCVCLLFSVSAKPSLAQTVKQISQLPTPLPKDIVPPTQSNSPAQTPKPELLPPSEQLLEPPSSALPTPSLVPESVSEKITVKQFEVIGNTVFSQKQLDKILAPYTNRSLSFTELFQVRTAITKLYVDEGYITSGALIPAQTIKSGIVKIQIIQGSLESIKVTGTRRLNPFYIRNRLPRSKPLNQKRLLEALRLLQLNPRIKNIQAELSTGSRLDTSYLNVRVQEASTFSAQLLADNGRSPSVGSSRRRVQLNEANLLGLGDGLSVAYTNTNGSNSIDLGYTLPINSDNGTLSFNYGFNHSNVVEDPFNALDIIGNYHYYELTLQQPVVETPNRELIFGLGAARLESDISSDVLKNFGYPLSLLSPGADNEGNTRISTIEFFQQWTNRSSLDIFAARSQFNLGIGAFDATINSGGEPDSSFFSWLGQVQWVRQMAPDTLLLLRSNFQLASEALVPLQQFGVGGIDSVRGYRQDALLGDNAVFASGEIRLPIYRNSKQNLLLQVTPFVDFGTTWDSGIRFNDQNLAKSDTLASVGLGLRLQLSNRLTARFDWGIPLIDLDTREKTWQEKGLYFSINYNPF